MTVLIIIALIVIAYYLGRSKGIEVGEKKAQQYTLEIRKKG